MIPILLALTLAVPPATPTSPGIISTFGSTPTLHGGAAAYATPNVTNPSGGPVISNVKIAMILYGNATFPPQVDGTQSPNIQSFYALAVSACTMDWLSEYNTPTQTIGAGRYIGMRRITPDPSRDGGTVTDQQIRDELATQIDNGAVPAPDNSTLYMIHLRPGQTVTFPGESYCTQFCAYHWNFVHNGQQIYYAIIPDIFSCPNGCQGTFAALTMVAHHEIVEAITDPVVGAGWTDKANNEEIADDCAWQQQSFVAHDGYTYTLQYAWSQSRGACYVAPSPPDMPVVQSPADGASGQPSTGVLDWTDAARATSYLVTLRCSTGVVYRTLSTTSSQLAYTLSPALYSWTVEGIDACGQHGPPSPPRTFSIGATPVCAVPVPLTPANGDSCVSVNGMITWQPIPGATGYVVRIVDNSGMCINSNGNSIDVATNQYSYSGLHAGHTYYWRVKEDCPCADFTDCVAFTTAPDVNHIHAPNLTSPANNASGVALSGTLVWQAVGGAVAYVVQWGTACSSGPETLVTSTSFAFSGLQQNTSYVWRVRAQDVCGQQSAYSSCFTFKTKALTGIDRAYLASDLTFAAGDTLVEIPIRAENLSSLREFDLDFSLDPAVFQYVGWTLTGTRAEGASTVNVQPMPSGEVRVQHVIIPPNNQCPPNLGAGDGDVFIVRARVPRTAALGPSAVTFNNNCRFIPCTGPNVTPATFANSITITAPATGVPHPDGSAPAFLALSAAAPNPTRGSTELRFSVPTAERVRLVISDIAGREVARLVDGERSPGWHSVNWDGTDMHGQRVPGGVYLAHLAGDGPTQFRRVIVIR